MLEFCADQGEEWPGTTVPNEDIGGCGVFGEGTGGGGGVLRPKGRGAVIRQRGDNRRMSGLRQSLGNGFPGQRANERAMDQAE